MKNTVGSKTVTSQNTTLMRARTLLTILLVTITFLLISSLHPDLAQAAARTWDGGGIDNNWSTCANWSGDVCPVAGDSLTFDSTSTKNATIDAALPATSVATLFINTGYTGTITQAKTFSYTSSFFQVAGSYTASNQTFTSFAFTLSGGSFTASSATTTVTSTFSVSGTPTFNANGGSFVFSGSGVTLSCANITFNTVTLSKTSGTSLVISSDCTLPLGNNPTVTTSSNTNLQLDGTLTGTGTLTYSGGNGLVISSTGGISGFSGLITTGLFLTSKSLDISAYTTFGMNNGNLSVANSTLKLPAATTTLSVGTFTISGTSTFTASPSTMNVTGAFSISGTTTFNANGGTFTFSGSGTTTACNNVTFNRVNISKTSGTTFTVGSDCSFPLGNNPTMTTTSGGSGYLILNGAISGTGTLTFSSGSSNYIDYTSTGSITGFSALSAQGLNMSGGTFDMSGYTSATITNNLNVVSGTLKLPPTASAGAVNLSGGTFQQPAGSFSVAGGLTITAGTHTIPSSTTITGTLTISGGNVTFPSGNLPITGSLSVSGTPTINGNGGTITMNGSTPTIACTVSTFNKIVIATSGITTISAGCTVPLGANPTVSNGILLSGGISGSGTLTETTGQLNMQSTSSITGFTAITGTSNSLRLNSANINFSSYTSIDIPQGFTSNGTSNFTMPNGTMNVGATFDLATGTMTAGSGTVNFTGSTGVINCNNQTFNLVTFTGLTGVKTVNANCSLPLGNNPTISNGITLAGTLSGSGTLTLSAGTLTLNSGATLSSFTGLTVPALTVSGATANLSGLTSLTVSGATSVSSGTATFPDGASLAGGLTISSTGVVVAPTGTLYIGGTFAHTAGTFTHSNGTVNFNGTSQSITGIATTFYNLTKTLPSASAATLTFPVSVTETITGTLTLNGYDASNRLSLRSSSAGTRFQIDAQGTRNMLYLDVKDGNSVNATVIDMGGTGSNDSLNNINFNFNSAAPNAPSSLGPSSVISGALVTSLQPLLTFLLSDPNPLDTIKFQIQISTVANFATTVIDYTSRLLSQNSTSFQVGQQINSGVYTIGQYGQQLATGDYFWRVRATDNNGLTSSFATANSGAVAFSIDATPPNDFTPVLTPASPTSTTQPVLTFSTTDNIGVTQYLIKIDGSAYIARTSPYTLPVMSVGTHTLYVRAYDSTGNFTEKILTLVIVSPATPTPTPSATATPTPTSTPSPTATPTVAVGSAGTTVTASDGSGAAVVVGSGVSSIDLSINLAQSQWTVIGQSGYPSVPPSSDGLSYVGNLTSLSITSTYNGATVTSLDAPVVISLPYPDTTTSTNLKVASYDQSTSSWNVVSAPAVVSPTQHIVSTTTSQPGYYAVILGTSTAAEEVDATPTPKAIALATSTPTPQTSPSTTDTPEQRDAVIEKTHEQDSQASTAKQILGAITQAAATVAAVANTTAQAVEPVAPVAPVAVTAAASVATVGILVWQIGFGLRPDLLIKLIQAIGLLPHGIPQGLVYNGLTLKPIPFAMLTFVNQAGTIQETTVTNEHGVYGGVKLAKGMYTLSVVHQDFAFPSKQTKPLYLGPRDFYTGEPFTVATERQEQLFLVPVDAKANGEEVQGYLRLRLKLALNRILLNKERILLLFTVFTLVMTLIKPTVPNLILTCLYVFVVMYRLLRAASRPLIVGTVVDKQGNPIPDVVVKAVEAGTNQLRSVTQTTARGDFRIFVPPGKYQLSFLKNGYVWEKYANSLGMEEVNVAEPTKMDSIVFIPVTDLYANVTS